MVGDCFGYLFFAGTAEAYYGLFDAEWGVLEDGDVVDCDGGDGCSSGGT